MGACALSAPAVDAANWTPPRRSLHGIRVVQSQQSQQLGGADHLDRPRPRLLQWLRESSRANAIRERPLLQLRWLLRLLQVLPSQQLLLQHGLHLGRRLRQGQRDQRRPLQLRRPQKPKLRGRDAAATAANAGCASASACSSGDDSAQTG